MAKTVLVVDDDPTQRRLIQAVLEREGFCVVLAHNVARYQAVAPAVALAELNRRRDLSRTAQSKRDH